MVKFGKTHRGGMNPHSITKIRYDGQEVGVITGSFGRYEIKLTYSTTPKILGKTSTLFEAKQKAICFIEQRDYRII